MSHFRVLRAGPLTTIQDTGRFGYSHIGLTEGGAMDYRSFVIANKLVGNEPTAAALEITLGGVKLQCLQNSQISLTGAFCPITINGKPAKNWQAISLIKDDVIDVGFAALGVRSYLAFSGGLASDMLFGSQATVVRENIGQPVLDGDVLTLAEPRNGNDVLGFSLNFKDQPSLRKSATLRFIAGYQWQQIPQQSQHLFLNSTFEISAQNDRMGYRVEGEKIQTDIEAIYSEGISVGAIQIAGNGQPIILMRDHQTIGGYPKLGSVITSDLDVLAQLPQRSKIKFECISPEQAIELVRSYHNSLDKLQLNAL